MKKLFTILLALVSSVGMMWGETKVYTKVTSASDLVSGSKYIFAELSTNTKYIASTTWGSSKYNSVTEGFSVSNDGNTITVTTATVLELTLGTATVDQNTYYTFNDGTYYIGKSSSNTNFERSETLNAANHCWTITSFTDGYCATSTRSGQTSRYWGRNSSTFGPYNNTNSYPKAALFRLDESQPSLKAEGGNLSDNALTFGTIETAQTSAKTFNLSAKNLTANASLAISGTDAAMFSVSPTSVTQASGTIASTAIRVEYNPTEVGDHTATLTISSTGASNVQISLSGSATAPATKYYINASAPVGGSYTVQVGEQAANDVTDADIFEAAEGQIITLTTAASTGYKPASTPFNVKKVSDESTVSVSKNGDNYTFTMPAEEVTITANYSVVYTITAAACTNGSITKIADNAGNEITGTSQGSKVVVTVAPAVNYTLDELYYIKEGEVTHNAIANGTFNMVSSNVTVYATFKEAIKGFEDALVVFDGTGTSSDESKQYMLNAAYEALNDAQKDTKYIPITSMGLVFESGASYISDITATNNISPARTNNSDNLGVKVGASSKAGAITFTLADAKILQSIVVRASKYSDKEGDNGFTITLNEGDPSEVSHSFPLSAGNKVLEDCVFYLEENYTVSSVKILQNQASSGRFYMQSIQFNVPSVDVEISDAEYATFYSATSAYVMPANLEGITVEGVSGTTLALESSYAAGDVVPAGEALILHGAATTYTLYAGITSEEKIAQNMLKGTSKADEWTTGGDVYYRLSQHGTEVGFYWGAAEGAAFQPGANKAYLALPADELAPARFIFGQQDVPTELQNVSAEAVSRKVVIDGRLYIVRDGNMFDLNGRLVK